MIDNQYKVIIGGMDFSDIIAMDGGYKWTVNSFSAESTTGQDLSGVMHVPILGERVQLAFECPPYITKERLNQLVTALELGSKGQRAITVSYDDPLFGQVSRKFYCANLPWVKAKLPTYPSHYGAGITFQLASSSFMGSSVVEATPLLTPQYASDADYKFKINGNDFSDIIDMEGFKGQVIEQSLESQTGLTLDGVFHLPVIGSRSQIEIDAIEYIEINRFRQLGKALGFGKLGERSHELSYVDMVRGQTTQKFYCTEISGTRVKLPNYPYHYIKDVKFQQAMKQFF